MKMVSTMNKLVALMLLAALPRSVQAQQVLRMVEAPPVEAAASDRWIGVECDRVDDALRAQLNLAPDMGLLVLEVIPEGPAGKAGVVRHDILLTANGKKLGEVRDLVATVASFDGKPLRVELLRGGKPQVVDMTPVGRPADFRWSGPVVSETDGDVIRELQDWISRQGQGQMPAMSLRLYHPGMVLPHGKAFEPQLPDDTSVSIEKQGSQPARVTVRRGDKAWQTTIDRIDQLPEPIRSHVAAFLAGTAAAGATASQGGAAAPTETQPSASAAPPAAAENPMRAQLERQMRDANQQLEQQMRDLARQMEQMQKQLQGIAPPDGR
ncbi:MAG TPA: PDZ domain-containing protein [Pirellulales bacterium]|nr:PDZ domain-containing protein [Pirellulales bacterium]